jgi:ketosteroid isomerase-like protein
VDATEVVKEAFRRLDEEGGAGFAELLAEDVQWWHPSSQELSDREAVAMFLDAILSGFPGSRHTLDRVDAVGDTVYAVASWTGTNTEPVVLPPREVPATGRTATAPFALSATVRTDRVVAMRIYMDQLTLLQQLGLIAEPAVAA